MSEPVKCVWDWCFDFWYILMLLLSPWRCNSARWFLDVQWVVLLDVMLLLRTEVQVFLLVDAWDGLTSLGVCVWWLCSKARLWWFYKVLSLLIVRGQYIPRANLSCLQWKALICCSSVTVIDQSSELYIDNADICLKDAHLGVVRLRPVSYFPDMSKWTSGPIFSGEVRFFLDIDRGTSGGDFVNYAEPMTHVFRWFLMSYSL